MRRLILPVALTALVASTALAGPAFAADPDAPVPGVTDSARLSTPVLVAGTVEGADGAPAAGVPVAIRVWPDSETLGKLPIGASVPTQIVGTAVTDGSGGYELRVDPSKSVSKLADPNGFVSLEVVAGTGASSSTFSLPRAASDLASSGAARSTAPAVSQVDLALSAQSEAASVAKSELAAAPAVACSLQKLATYGGKWTVVGETYTHPGSTAKFTYTAGSTSSLGIAVSTGGVFSASGSSTVTNSATIGFPTTPVNSARQWRTQFRYDKFTDLCGHIYARPTAFLGGAGIVYAVTIAATKCVAQVPNTSFTKSTTTASTLSGGVDTSSDIGIDLSARTGFTTTAKVTYTFAQGGQMCGTTGFPGASPGRLAAKS